MLLKAPSRHSRRAEARKARILLTSPGKITTKTFNYDGGLTVG